MGHPKARPVLLLSGRTRHDESLPLDGSVPMPSRPLDEGLVDDPPRATKSPLFKPSKSMATTPPQEDTVGRNDTAGESRQRFIDLFKREKRWLKVSEIANAVGMSRMSCKYHLTALEEQGVIKSRGKTSARRYAQVDLPDVAPATPTEEKPRPAKRKPALRRKTARAKRQRREARPAPRSLPVAAEPVAPPVAANDGMVCAINDSGALGITKGAERIALEATDIRTLLRFLDHTKPLWRGRRAA